MIMSTHGSNPVVFWGYKWLWVFWGVLWVAKVGFGRLKVVIGGYEWLSGVCVWVLPRKCNPDNKSSLQNVSS